MNFNFRVFFPLGFQHCLKKQTPIPENWILPCNNDSNLFAKWPTLLNVTSDIICAAANPLPEWQCFKIKLLDDGKECSKLFQNNFLKYLI